MLALILKAILSPGFELTKVISIQGLQIIVQGLIK